MIERRVKIGTPIGLHARPVSRFVQKVNSLSIDVTIGTDGAEPVDARSIMSVLSLGIAGGQEVVLASTSAGGSAEAALDELSTFLAGDLDSPAAT